MKVLHIMNYDIYNGTLTGGSQVAAKNHQILVNVFGEENTYLLIFSKYCSKNHKEQMYTLPIRTNAFEEIMNAIKGYRRFHPKLKKEIKVLLDMIDPDIVFLDSSELGQITKLLKKDVKSIVHFHNIEVDYIWKNRVKRKKISGFPVLYATYINEKLSVKKCDRVICLNERDNKRLQKVYKRNADLLLPVSFEDKFDKKKIHKDISSRKLIFIGSLFPPNLQGIEWFVKEVMIHLSDFELVIVGHNFEKKRKELERKNVRVIGTVDNLEEYYYSYSSVVMPIKYGDGMKVKTAEAMMYGMNIFATTEALEGYKTEGIKGICKCNTANEFIYCIRNAFENGKIEECAMDVRKSFLENNEIKKQINTFKGMIENL